MTIAIQPLNAREASKQLRLEVAWTVSSLAAGGSRSYSSAVLHVECEWKTECGGSDSASPGTAAGTKTPVSLVAQLLSGAKARTLALPDACVAYVDHRAPWTHVRFCAGEGGQVLLTASFEHGRLVYGTGSLPQIAGLSGATYDAPTGTLDELP